MSELKKESLKKIEKKAEKEIEKAEKKALSGSGPKMERTFIMIKPDGVQIGIVGEVIRRFEQSGLKLAAVKMVTANEQLAERHYLLTDAWISKLAKNTREAFSKKGVELKETDREIAERVQSWLKKYLMEGPVVAMVWEGYHAIEIGRKLVGHTEPRQAAPGTIRGDFTVDSYVLADYIGRPIRNLVHASGNDDEAKNEINIWFSENEIFDYQRPLWKVMH